MTNEKTPLLKKPQSDTVIVTISAEKLKDFEFDINNNSITTSLTYEELLPFLIDPSWIRLRKICFTACWISFFVILLAACISSFMSMSKMSCISSSMAASRADNVVAELAENEAKGILSIVLNTAVNSTVTT